MKRQSLIAPLLLCWLFASPLDAEDSTALTLKKGDRVVLIGNTLAERMQYFGHFETLLHAQFPKHELVVRNLGFSADELRFRPRSLDFGSPDHHLSMQKADVILAFFGFNESFAGPKGLPAFEAELEQFIKHTLGQKYNGKTPARLVLVSPIAHENHNNPNLPDGRATNTNLEIYTKAMNRIAGKHGVPFVDAFRPSRKLMNGDDELLTINGVHLNEYGDSRLAPVLMRGLFGNSLEPTGALEKLRAEVNEKSFQFYHRYRAVNGYYIYGGRSRRDHSNPPYTDAYVIGNELKKLDEMAALRDRRIWKVARGGRVSAKIDDSKTRPLYKVPTNFKEPIKIVSPEQAMKHFTVAKGYKVNLFASEIDFPDLKNPVQITFDTRGRLWVATMPSYPMYQPPDKPDDKLLIFEDTDGDGRADKQTIFAGGLHVPTGFELGDGGVYVAQQPNLMFLKDTDGDDKADVRELILHGFDSGDSHHSIGAFVWGPGGGLYLHEGTFHHSSVETPYGPVRNAHGGVYRYDPTTRKFETFVHYNFANPWGHAFDRWGQNFVADASGGANYFGTAFSVKSPQFTGQPDFGPFKFAYRSQMKQFFPKRVRPTAGCELVSSRHFPPEAQGNYLLNNCIGFQGVLQHTVREEGSGFVGKEIEPILFSSDRNFRPTDLQFGPDGALYIVDWFNPLVGHMQHSLRDPNRDHSHGRVWRITYPSRPLVKPPKIEGQPIAALLDLLKTYEDRTRDHVRLKLREFDSSAVTAELDKWIAGLDKNDRDYEHHLLEALWVRQHHNAVDEKLLKRLLRSPDYRARAAATRVLCYWRDQVPGSLDLIRIQANDEHPRVRLEAVRACSYFEDARAAEIALEILKQPTDYYLDYTLKETMNALQTYWKPVIAAGKPFAADNPAGVELILSSVPTPDLTKMSRNAPVYVALLSRANVRHEFRIEALRGLAKMKKTNEMSELLAAIQYADQRDIGQARNVLYDLAHMLTARNSDELKKARGRLQRLAIKSKRPITRQIGFVAMVTADGTVDKAWNLAVQSASGLRDLLQGIPLIPDPKLRAALYPQVAPLLHGLPKSLAKRLQKQKSTVGRYVRIELPGRRRTLTLAEVQVFSKGSNVARRGKARQKSTAFGGNANRAIDGNTSGRYADGGQTHTKGDQRNPWWELDLGSDQPIEAIVVWNRSENDGQFAKRLDGFKLTVLDSARRPVFTKADNRAPLTSGRFELKGDPTGIIRRAAINAVTSVPGHGTESFKTLAGFVHKGDQRHTAVRALSRIPKYKWPKDDILPLAQSIVRFAKSVPAKQRVRNDVRDALQLGNELASLLPAAQAKTIRTEIGELGVRMITIRTVPHRMRYDRSVIAVQAGKPVEIVLENGDIMPHNLIITQPGTMIEVAQAAERMATQPDAFAKQFVPDSPKILHATRMLQPTENQRLVFVAPKQPGEYPYVCTFPGHWRMMNGMMHVVADLESFLTENPIPEPIPVESRKFVRNWKFDDLADSLSELENGRSYVRGKNLFAAAACIQCHRMNEVGGMVGPDMAKLDQKMQRADILRELLEPSKVIKDKFKSYLIVTDEGKQFIGMILSQSDTSLQLAENPLGKAQHKPMTIPLQAIEIKKELKVSLMPEKLLNTLTKEEILDLLAYLESRGNSKHPLYTK